MSPVFWLSRHLSPGPVIAAGFSDDCARHLAAHFIMHCERSAKLEALASQPVSGSLIGFAVNRWASLQGRP